MTQAKYVLDEIRRTFQYLIGKVRQGKITLHASWGDQFQYLIGKVRHGQNGDKHYDTYARFQYLIGKVRHGKFGADFPEFTAFSFQYLIGKVRQEIMVGIIHESRVFSRDHARDPLHPVGGAPKSLSTVSQTRRQAGRRRAHGTSTDFSTRKGGKTRPKPRQRRPDGPPACANAAGSSTDFFATR